MSLDFILISTKFSKSSGAVEVYPRFIIKKSADLMIRGGDFYAIWDEEVGLWSTSEQRAIDIIDHELDLYAETHKSELGHTYSILHLWDAANGQIDSWHKYVHDRAPDSYEVLDDHLVFANDEVNKKDHASKRLSYPLERGEHPAWDKLVSTLYDPNEQMKIEWCIGSIVTGDSRYLQKFAVFYGSAGTGKSTILNIISKLFEGYITTFDAKALGSSSNVFALEAFKSNPLVAIQHDGDLSRIEDNTRLNSLVSHETMVVNEKYKSTYANRFNCFLFMGTNRPVKITDAKSGLIRRLIDISPSGRKLDFAEYQQSMRAIDFELGAIAEHCGRVYLANKNYYDSYIPLSMMSASNDFYNFMLDSYMQFESDDAITLKSAWALYKSYCEDAKLSYPFTQRVFKEELKNYFQEYDDRYTLDDGTRVRSYYRGFRTDRFSEADVELPKPAEAVTPEWLDFSGSESAFDILASNYPAQYATAGGKPLVAWDKVTTTLHDLSTASLHYVRVPLNHIVIDFDLKGPDGNKSLERNLEAAASWPATYAELSKSGQGIHLHYLYSGDPNELSSVFAENVEVKVFTGLQSLRRKLTKCNRLQIATISSGLPKKEVTPVVDTEFIYTEKKLRKMIIKAINKEYHPDTASNVNYIKQMLDDAYASGVVYNVSDLRDDIYSFAMHSTHQSKECLRKVADMKFMSAEPAHILEPDGTELMFYDVEVFPNLFIIVYKLRGENNPCIKMINPDPEDVERLISLTKMRDHKYGLVGFNNRDYDNHMLYARTMGYTTAQLFDLSKRIIDRGDRDAKFRDAYNISYTDVYDFSSKKQSLKKWEIELGIHHHELGLPWDQPVPEEKWPLVADYCCDDVIATEAVFEHLADDWSVRCMLADISGATRNDKTNTHSTRIIFQGNKHPQDQFNYRNLGDVNAIDWDVTRKICESLGDVDERYTVFDSEGRPIFPGYTYDKYKRESHYRDHITGEGGLVTAAWGVWTWTVVLDIKSMHPSTIIAEKLFGDYYTARFEEIKNLRVAIKEKRYDDARTMFGGAFAEYLVDKHAAKKLAKALKIVINSVYGLTSATFENEFKDPRNIDNIVAKRGALFMLNLKNEVERRGFQAVHIKTDSIKIPNATPEIIDFVMRYGKAYGYEFDHESTYSKMCLVNNAVYIAKYATDDWCMNAYGYLPSNLRDDHVGGQWTATGTQFQVPYVFKTLFSHEPLEFADLCETKSVKNSSIFLDMNERLPDVSAIDNQITAVRNKKNREMSKGIMDNVATYDETIRILSMQAEEGHSRHFVGRVGSFCPIASGKGGGILVREVKHPISGDISYSAVTGTKGYRWLESEYVQELHKEDSIDTTYFNALADKAKEEIAKYTDVDWFVSDDENMPASELTPPWESPDDPWEHALDEASELFVRR